MEKAQNAGHVTSLKVYIVVGALLFLLTGVTVEISRIHLGAWNAVVALGIATVKGLLVALFFMHLLHDKKIYAIIVSLALVMLSLLIILTMADILSRGDINDYQSEPIHPQAEMYSKRAAGTPSHGEAAEDTLDHGAGSESEGGDESEH